MYYIDTSILISYIFASDRGHDVSRRILEDIAIKRKQKLYASSFTLAEACNVICRKIIRERKWLLIEPLQRYVDAYKDVEERCQFLLSLIINFLRERLGIEFIDDESFYKFESIGFNRLRVARVFKVSTDLSYKLTLRIKDLLHLVYAYMMSETYRIKYFLTRDVENFEKVKDVVKRLLRIEIILVR